MYDDGVVIIHFYNNKLITFKERESDAGWFRRDPRFNLVIFFLSFYLFQNKKIILILEIQATSPENKGTVISILFARAYFEGSVVQGYHRLFIHTVEYFNNANIGCNSACVVAHKYE